MQLVTLTTAALPRGKGPPKEEYGCDESLEDTEREIPPVAQSTVWSSVALLSSYTYNLLGPKV